MKKVRFRHGSMVLAACLLFTLFLGGCGSAVAEAETTGEQAWNPTVYTGMLQHEFGDEAKKENGKAVAVYSGGEMRLSYKIHSMENLLEAGFGLGISLDGIPQPFKLTDNGETAYFQTIDMKGEKSADIELIFTPVVGKAGDKLELTVYSIVGPEYFDGDPMTGPFQSDYSMMTHAQLEFLADPETQNQEAMASGTVTMEAGENPEMASLKMQGNKVRTVEEADILSWQLSAPAGKDYRVVVYVDHQPVSVTDIPTMEAGKIATVELPLPEMEGEHICYALAFDRNWRAQGSTPDTTASETSYFTAK